MAWPVSTRTTGTLITAAIYNSDLVDNLNAIINASGNLAIAGTGPHAIGGAVSATAGLGIYGTVAPLSGIGSGVVIGQTIQAVVNQSAYGFYLSPTLVEAGSGTHNLFVGMYLASPTITAGAAAVTNAATLYIAGAPAAGVNTLALWVDSGGTRLDGALYLSEGGHGVGTPPVTHSQLSLGGSFSPTGQTYGSALEVVTSLTPEVNDDCYGFLVAPTFVEAGSGAHGSFMGAQFNAPIVTAGAATLTNAVTVAINGVPSATATFTAALLIETGADDGVHVALSSSDVAHGITSLAPTTVYGLMRKSSATEGGLSIQGYTEGDNGLKLSTVVTTAVTTETGGSGGAITLISELKTGTSSTVMAADDNTVVFKNNVNATHIFKGNGSSYEDVGASWTVFDEFDDVALIEALEVEITTHQGRPIQQVFCQWIVERRALLERLRLATFGADGRIFVNRSGMQALLCGFARQLTARVLDLETRVLALEAVRG